MKHIIPGVLAFLCLPFFAGAAVGPAGSIDTLSVNMVDSVNADARASVYAVSPGSNVYVEFGPTQSFGRQTYGYRPQSGKVVLVELRLFNLTPNVTYFYRAVIEGTAGVIYGGTKTFLAGGGNDALFANNAASGNTGVAGTGDTGDGGSAANASANGGTSNTNSGTIALTGSAGNAFGSSGVVQSGPSAPAQNPGGFFQRIFDAAVGDRPLQLSVGLAPEKPSARQIVEYTVVYKNGSARAIGGGTLSLALPSSVIYLGDNSGGKTTVLSVSGGQKLTLPLGGFSGNESRTLTVMAIASSAVVGSPVAVADVSYTNAKGAVQHVATREGAQVAAPLIAASAASNGISLANGSPRILPSSFFDWLIFMAIVTILIVSVRRVMSIYQERKKRLLAEEASSAIPTPA